MKKFCPHCMAETDVHVISRFESINIKGTDIGVSAQVYVCDACGEDVWDDELDEKTLVSAYDEYRRMNNLLLPNEIKAIRESYGVSQSRFAQILGLGEKTITRYENGSLQDRAYNNLILLVKDYRNFRKLNAIYENTSVTTESHEALIYQLNPKQKMINSVVNSTQTDFQSEYSMEFCG